MGYKLKEAPRALEVKDKCRHHWVIEGARGPTSRGVCKLCGAEKEFHNSWPSFAAHEGREKAAGLPPALEGELEREAEPEKSEVSV